MRSGRKFFNKFFSNPDRSYTFDRINPWGFKNPKGFRIDFFVNRVSPNAIALPRVIRALKMQKNCAMVYFMADSSERQNVGDITFIIV